MKARKELFLLNILLLQIFALSLIFVSLVVNNSPHPPEIPAISTNNTKSKPLVNKIVLVIVDALRYDFAPEMSFVNRSLTNGDSSCIFKVALSGPTVTLPRIKALVTGTKSSYWDFLANLKQSVGINVDNIIAKAKEGGKRIVFYGDDTWLKLFPGDEFLRAEGVSSFFVTDFYEVDDNVTRKVKEELREAEFDLMILHYLGLDHIGHVHGPRHPLIPTKLEEMNAIVEEVYERLRKVKSELPHLIILTGDHGMANQGGHGGDSLPEVTTPLVLLPVSAGNVKTRICKRPSEEWFFQPFNIKQTDIPSILTFLWDLPFPKSSRGVIPSEILSEFEPETRLTALYRNSRQLATFLTNGSQHEKLVRNLDSLSEKYEAMNASGESETLEKEFQELLTELKAEAVQETECDIVTLIFTVLLQFLSILIVAGSYEPNYPSLSLAALTIGSYLTSLVFNPGPSFVQYLVASLTYFLWRKRPAIDKPGILAIFKKDQALGFIGLYLLSPVLFFSSSFVEEEHFFLYYFYASTIVISILRTKNLNLALILPLHRLCSAFNATGQKWNNELDLNDFFKQNGTLQATSCGLAFLLLVTFFCRNFVQRVCLLTIALYKLQAVDFFLVPKMTHWEAKLCYFLILLVFVTARKKLSVSWILLSCLLQRPENVILVPLVCFQMKLIEKCDDRARELLLNLLFFASFYYQGNSNHISTIDISLGYTGLSEYNEVMVGVLTFVSTFSLPILVFVLGMEFHCETGTGKASRNFGMELLVLKTVVTNFIYGIVVIVMRQHLFIWSVFVPKILYLIGFTFLVTSIQVFIVGKETVLIISSLFAGGKSE